MLWVESAGITMFSETVGRIIRDPKILVRELNSQYHRRLNLYKYNPGGVDVMSEDWDTLIILDACRFDSFEKVNHLPGELGRRESRGAGTKEFLMGNFKDRQMFDTVYVTANPQFYWNREQLNAKFHAVLNIWKEDGWDNKYGTVLPRTTTKYAIKADKQFPNKRLIIHYLQPHLPFIGPTGDDNPQLSSGFDHELELSTPDVDRQIYEQAYKENLEIVLEEVEDLLENLTGRTVITADHGQVIGERLFPIPVSDFGHWRGNYIEQLIKVPWLIHTDGRRKQIKKDMPKDEDEWVDDEIVKNRLQNLGYVTDG